MGDLFRLDSVGQFANFLLHFDGELLDVLLAARRAEALRVEEAARGTAEEISFNSRHLRNGTVVRDEGRVQR